jgi:penicillin-binding protein-related factor A (putative recombinase)
MGVLGMDGKAFENHFGFRCRTRLVGARELKGGNTNFCYNCAYAWEWDEEGELKCNRLKDYLFACRQGMRLMECDRIALCKNVCDNFVPFTQGVRFRDIVGMKGIKNIADFFIFSYPNLIYFELKTIEASRLPFTRVSDYQREGCLSAIKTPGVVAGILIYFYDKKINKVFWVDIEHFIELTKGKVKSVTWQELGSSAGKLKESGTYKGYKVVELVPNITNLNVHWLVYLIKESYGVFAGNR